MILNREQIDRLRSASRHAEAAGKTGTYLTVEEIDSAAATASAYHDLRDAVLALCDRANAMWDGFIPTGNLREAVARVDRDNSA